MNNSHPVDSLGTLVERFNLSNDLEEKIEIQEQVSNLYTIANESGFLKDQKISDLFNRIMKEIENVIHRIMNPPKKDTKSIQLAEVITLPSIGIKNQKNDCWANSLLQLLSNAPRIAERIIRHKNDGTKNFSHLLENYYIRQDDSKSKSLVNSREFRNYVPEFQKNLENYPGVFIQEDPDEALCYLFEKIGFNYTLTQSIGGKTSPKQIEPMLRLVIGKNAKPQFDELMVNFFLSKTEQREKHLKFEKAPDDLIIKAERTYQDGYTQKKLTQNIENVPEIYHMYSAFSEDGQTPSYAIKSCVIHSGTLNGGHYISLTKKPDGWYRIDDNTVYKWDAKNNAWINTVTNRHIRFQGVHTPRQHLQQGTFYHYEKIEPAQNSPKKDASPAKEPELPKQPPKIIETSSNLREPTKISPKIIETTSKSRELTKESPKIIETQKENPEIENMIEEFEKEVPYLEQNVEEDNSSQNNYLLPGVQTVIDSALYFFTSLQKKS